MISVTIPLRTVTESNAKEHWRTKAQRARGQRQTAEFVVVAEAQHRIGRHPSWLLLPADEGPLVVTLTRLAKGTLDDDNLSSSQKHVRDGVADALGIDDRDPRVTWEYAQEKAKTYGVRIEIRRREA